MTGMVCAAVSTSCSAWRRSSSVETPPAWRDFVRSSDCCARLESTPGDFELVIQLAQRQVRGGHVADQRGDHGLAVLLRAQKIGARGLGGAPQPAPDIHFEREQTQRGFAEIAILRGQNRRGQWRGAVARETIDFHAAAGAEIAEIDWSA